MSLVKSPAIGINYDTGNSYLAGTTDTYEWLTHVVDRLVHLHAKDISISQSDAEAGQGERYPRRLCLRRWGGGLEANDRDRQKMPARISSSASRAATCRMPSAATRSCRN